MTLEEKIQQLNQQAFGLNLNANNQGQTLHDVAPDIGSLIFLNEDPVERNSIQRRAMEESRLGIPILFGFLSSRWTITHCKETTPRTFHMSTLKPTRRGLESQR